MGKRQPQGFRNHVVKLASQGDASYTKLAKHSGVTEASIFNWVKQSVLTLSVFQATIFL